MKRGIIMANEKSLKVLIVDDDKNICDLLRLYLEKDGYSVILSHDGEEAVVKFNALKPDMVLLDIMLPGMDGWQVCTMPQPKTRPDSPVPSRQGPCDRSLKSEVPCGSCLNWR